jgi:DNA-binding response OmpR family regulator
MHKGRAAEGKRVLLVTDGTHEIRGWRSTPEASACAITLATTVRQARTLLETEDFDLLIATRTLPDGSGAALAHDARALGLDHLLLGAAEHV